MLKRTPGTLPNTRIFKSKKQLQRAILDYFEEVPDKEKQTMTGFILHVFNTRHNLQKHYEHEEFKELIDYGRLMVEHSYEYMMKTKGGAGFIFGLKNMGWTDQINIDNNVTHEVDYSKLTDRDMKKLMELRTKEAKIISVND